jgi:ISXO2 transposase-like protein
MKRDLKVARKTAWYLNHRIRKAMGLIEAAYEEPLAGTVDADETYVGTKKYDRRRKRAQYQQVPVFGIVERGAKQGRTVSRRESVQWNRQTEGQYLDRSRSALH